eukprot:TRINITY_DN7710_c0_g1_i1.p2 TRINITY_DN7710_c0_g1~~TRINITY_DN7710_c0_g1_i1.p2  ORF type:complete len:109 (-),score=17.56 TRINITY_DN7710_c0_g1_i1:31-336(-)
MACIPHKEGVLHKLGGVSQSDWQPRYFVLQGSELHYHKVRGGPEKGKLRLQGATIQQHPEEPLTIIIDGPLVGKEKMYYLKGLSAKDTAEWISAMQTASHS